LAAGSAVFIFALGLTVLAGWFFHTPGLIQFGDTTSSNDAQRSRVFGAVWSRRFAFALVVYSAPVMNGMNQRGSIES
jgi:hypothetical protein